MGVTATVVAAVVATLVATLICSEVKALLPKLCEWLVKWSANRLDPELRSRAAEDWTSAIEELPTPLSKFVYAVFLPVASYKLAPPKVSTADFLRMALIPSVVILHLARLTLSLPPFRAHTSVLRRRFELSVEILTDAQAATTALTLLSLRLAKNFRKPPGESPD